MPFSKSNDVFSKFLLTPKEKKACSAARKDIKKRGFLSRFVQSFFCFSYHICKLSNFCETQMDTKSTIIN